MTLFKYVMKKALKTFIIFFALVLILLLGVLVNNNSLVVKASTDVTSNGYSDVMSDLNRDKNFNVNKYSVNDSDYNLYVIQIAESIEDELFIYVYQPSHFAHDLIATSITFSNSLSDEGNEVYTNYLLKLVSTDGVFDKYLVNDFSVNTSIKDRYYEITSLYRKPDGVVDNLPAGYEIEELAIGVSQRWYVKEIEDSVTYACDTIETIQVTAQYPGYVRYKDGYYLWAGGEYVDGYYYAFDTDRLIENLLEVEMVYDVTYTYYEVSAQHPFGETTETTSTKRNILRYDEYAETNGGLFAPKRSWKRIMLVDDFINYVEDVNGLNLSSKAKKNLQTCKWVVNFDEFLWYNWTDTTSSSIIVPSVTTSYSVSNIQALRFKFITKGVTYNLGVIGDIVTPDNQPSNDNSTSAESLELYFKQKFGELSDAFKYIILLICLLVVIIIFTNCVPLVKGVSNSIVNFFTWLFKTIGVIISAPFKLIGKLFKK